MVLKQRHHSGTAPMLSPQATRLSRESSAMSLPYGSALSPTSSSCHSANPSTSATSLNGSNSVIRRLSRSALKGSATKPKQLESPGLGTMLAHANHPLSPTFFGHNGSTATPDAQSNSRKSFWSSSGSPQKHKSSPSKGLRRSSSLGTNSATPANLANVLYCVVIIVCGYFIISTSQQLNKKETRLKQMRSDYHVLHHKVRETQNALTAANRHNHELEDRSKQLEKTNGKLQQELENSKKMEQKSSEVESDLINSEMGDMVQGLASDEIAGLLMRRQDAMKNRIGTLETKIQEISRREAEERFGLGPHRVEVNVDFNAGVSTANGRKDVGTFIVEMAPLDYMPHSVHLFLQMVAHKLWDDTVFLHTTHHVLQAAPIEFSTGRSKRDDFADAKLDQLSFQEYSEEYPHVKYTIGFGGRPGGPDFYISTQDNSRYHGPGGQGQHDLHEEADPCFGWIVDGHKIVDRMHRRSITTVGKNGEGWDGKDVPITSIVSMRVMEQD